MSEQQAQPAAQDTPKAEGTTTVTTETADALYKEAPKVETPVETKEPPKEVSETPKETIKPVEKYELKLPEGSPLQAEHIEKLSNFAKEKGLTQEQAQLFLERESSAVADFAQTQMAQLEQMKTEWFEAAKSDKEIGGDNFAESAENAKRVIQKYASSSLKEELNKTGYGNHPELLRIFARIGKEMANDKLVLSGSMAGAGKPIESIFYPDQNK